jgi:chemotaxis protein MotB
MKHVLSFAALVASSLAMVSCGASKKLSAASAEVARLNSVVTEQVGKLATSEKEIAQLKTENIQYGKEAQACRVARATIEEKLGNIEKNLAAKGTSMQEIRQRVAVAIGKFQDAGADVSVKNGMVHISFTDRFFFKSGSSSIGVQGREALNTVADALRENPGVTAIIVGNTDTASTKGATDNWSLSTERANAVVRVLHGVYNINPGRLTAAGRSKYHPIASNETPEGREKNRRIEIILNPDLSRIWDLMEP